MVMMECPETVNTLLHEFFLWEPDMSRKDSNNRDMENSVALSDPVHLVSKNMDK